MVIYKYSSSTPHSTGARKTVSLYGVLVSEIHELSALELGAAIQSGDVSPTEVAEHTSQRADEIGPTVGAFITTTPDLALEQAKVAEKKLRTAARSSEKISPLCGVP